MGQERPHHHPQWKGNVHASLKGPKADQVWLLLQDFFNLDKYFPTLSTSYGLQGTNGQPGCIRYCAGSSIPSNNNKDGDGGGGDARVLSWSSERLVAIDPVGMSLRYEMVDGNVGFESYMATMRVVPRDEQDGCVIQWGFVVDPVKGWKFEDLIDKYQKGLEGMARKIEQSFA